MALTDSGLILKLRFKNSYAGKKNSKRKLTVITRLWQDAVSELRSKGDIIELLIQLEDLQKLCDSLFFVKAALVILELPMIIR